MPVRLPDGLDPILGVFLANIETAANVVIDAAPRLGERVAVFGQGVVGLLITQLLRLTGVSQIIVVEPVALGGSSPARWAPTWRLVASGETSSGPSVI